MREKNSLSAVGWVLISRREVGQAEQALLGEFKGVRDEVGLLAIHQAVADRLFPGTSVLHTRLRYGLFVPWLMRQAARQSSQSPLSALRELETHLTGRLLEAPGNESDMSGIIGGRVYRASAAQPPSFSYWSALLAWSILRRTQASAMPSRESVLRALAAEDSVGRRQVKDEAGHSLSLQGPVFADDMPDAPDGFWQKDVAETFRLRPEEKLFFRNHLAAVKRPGDGAPSLLSRLALSGAGIEAESPWSDDSVVKLADSVDKEVLRFARQASALAGIGRAVYLCLVEDECLKLKFLDSELHRKRLQELRTALREDALALDLVAMRDRGLGLGDNLLFDLLEDTQSWLRGAGAPSQLLPIYKRAESRRKTTRARLANTPPARRRLKQWANEEGTQVAERLHFRWPNVRRLMRDLHNA